jgi:putative transposase
MPSKNRVKQYSADSFYHVYNRGVNKRMIFIDPEDYSVFLNLLKRYLSIDPVRDLKGREYKHLYGTVEMLAFCLMPNHFHMLIYQKDRDAITELLRPVITTYVIYFNKKYKRVGPLFQGVFKATSITNDAYCQHISRYIHLNPSDYKNWEYSSLPFYLGTKHADWVRPERIMGMFQDVDEYVNFVADYESQKEIMDELKHQLADS